MLPQKYFFSAADEVNSASVIINSSRPMKMRDYHCSLYQFRLPLN